MADGRYQEWLRVMREGNAFHRKVWEWCFILEAMRDSGLLRPGSDALGFGVGHEPVPAVLASYGVRVTATDQPEAGIWDRTNEHAGHVGALRNDGICDTNQFATLVNYQPVDMLAVPTDITSKRFHLVWSSCCVEHLGTPEAGLQFIRSAMNWVAPGGLAIHTTEYNIVDGDRVVQVDNPYTAFYRQRDLEALVLALRKDGHEVQCNFHVSNRLPEDRFVDRQPYKHSPHLKLDINGATVTSFGITVRRSS